QVEETKVFLRTVRPSTDVRVGAVTPSAQNRIDQQFGAKTPTPLVRPQPTDATQSGEETQVQESASVRPAPPTPPRPAGEPPWAAGAKSGRTPAWIWGAIAIGAALVAAGFLIRSAARGREASSATRAQPTAVAAVVPSPAATAANTP